MSACVCDRTIALGFQLGYLAHKVFRREASCVAVAAVVTALAARIAPVRPLAARDAEPSSMAWQKIRGCLLQFRSGLPIRGCLLQFRSGLSIKDASSASGKTDSESLQTRLSTGSKITVLTRYLT